LIRFSNILPDISVLAALLIPVTAGLDQLNVAPGVALVGLSIKLSLLHIASGESEEVNSGIGLTLTVIVCVLLHALALSVIVYTTSIGLGVALTNTSFMDALFCVVAALLIPLIALRVQEKVVPSVALIAVYENVLPLQIEAGVNVELITGVGFTQIETSS
jgi:hypothetical protein